MMIFDIEYQQAQTNDDPVHWRQNIWKEGHYAILRQAEFHKPMKLPAPVE